MSAFTHHDLLPARRVRVGWRHPVAMINAEAVAGLDHRSLPSSSAADAGKLIARMYQLSLGSLISNRYLAASRLRKGKLAFIVQLSEPRKHCC